MKCLTQINTAEAAEDPVSAVITNISRAGKEYGKPCVHTLQKFLDIQYTYKYKIIYLYIYYIVVNVECGEFSVTRPWDRNIFTSPQLTFKQEIRLPDLGNHCST